MGKMAGAAGQVRETALWGVSCSQIADVFLRTEKDRVEATVILPMVPPLDALWYSGCQYTAWCSCVGCTRAW